MTSKIIMSNLVRKGKQVLQGFLKTQKVGVKVVKTSKQTEFVQPVVRYESLLSPSRLNNVWKKILPKIYFRSLAREFGHQAAWRTARNLPLLSFVGLLVAQHADEEDNQIAERIQEFVKTVDSSSSTLLKRVQELSLDKFEFGQIIGKGCNAAVYEACLKSEDCSDPSVIEQDSEFNHTNVDTEGSESAPTSFIHDDSDTDSDITTLDESDQEVPEARRVPVVVHEDTDSEITVISLSEDSERATLTFYVDDDRVNDFDDESDTGSEFSVISRSDMEDDCDELEGPLMEFEMQHNSVNLNKGLLDATDDVHKLTDQSTSLAEQLDTVENGEMYNSVNSHYSDLSVIEQDSEFNHTNVDTERFESAPTSSIHDDSDTDSDITTLDKSDQEVREARRVPVVVHDDADGEITVLSLSEDSERAPLIFYVDDDGVKDFDDESDTGSDFSVISWSDMEDNCDEPEGPLMEFEMQHNAVNLNEGVLDAEHDVPVGTDHNLTDQSSSLNDQLDSMENGEVYNSLNSNYSEVGDKYNLAVKMMFNYGVESNADAILREMGRETVPARLSHAQGQMLVCQNGNKVRKKTLPPHPNIIEMWGVFVDLVPHLPGSLLNYPAALPAHINPNGIGRNMTMFLVMKKYQYTLGKYLSTFNPCFRERLFLLGQLLEAVAHMRKHGVAHRDMKLDNIFLDTTTGVAPQLVVGDFGCCLADDNYGMQIPYPTEHMDRGGNTALMAPEISTAEPGMFKYLDYRKADLWATATLAYEILGADNPFYTNQNRQGLDSRTYSMTELPPLPDNVPQPVRTLIYAMLEKEPNQRPTARFAADVIQVLLWAPSDWLLPSNNVSKSDITWWTVSMATEVLLGTRSPERMLKRNFVQNFCMQNLKSVLAFLDINNVK